MCDLIMIISLFCICLHHLLGLSAAEMSLTLAEGDLLTAPPGVDPYMVGDRIVLKFGPANRAGCGNTVASDQKMFAMPVVTNFPLPQLYCEGGKPPLAGGRDYRIATAEGRTLCASRRALVGLEWREGSANGGAACGWQVDKVPAGGFVASHPQVTGVSLPIENLVGGSGLGISVKGLLAVDDTLAEERQLPIGGASTRATARDGAGGFSHALAISADTRRFVSVASDDNTPGSRWFDFSSARHCGMAPMVADRPVGMWPPDQGWFVRFTLEVEGAHTGAFPLPLVLVGDSKVGVSIWLKAAARGMQVRWQPSGYTLELDIAPQNSSGVWCIHSNQTVSLDANFLQGEMGVLTAQQQRDMSALMPNSTIFRVSVFPTDVPCTAASSVAGLVVSDAGGRAEYTIFTMRSVPDVATAGCVLHPIAKPWQTAWHLGPCGADWRGTALPPDFLLHRQHKAP